MQIRALKAFSTGAFAMEQYEIRDVDDTLAASLIAQGLAAKVGGSGGVFVVTETSRTLSASYNDILAALRDGKTVQLRTEGNKPLIRGIIYAVNQLRDEYGSIMYSALGIDSSGIATPNFYKWDTQDPRTSSLTRS